MLGLNKYPRILIISIIYLLINVGLALFAPVIISDKSENANAQIPALALSQSGKTFQEIKTESAILYTHSYEIKTNEYILQTVKNEVLTIPKKSILEIKQKSFGLGSDQYGRDFQSRLILGLRISLIVGFIAMIISLVLGISIGLVSGYFGGIVDTIVLFIINTLWSLPTILFVFAMVLSFGQNIYIIFIAVGLTLWVDIARIVRGRTIQLREALFIKAGKAMFLSNYRILFKHILPNLWGPIVVYAASNFAIAILIESGLSFLGFGVQPPIPSLGNLLSENYKYAFSGYYSISLLPALAIMLIVLTLNLISKSLNDIFDINK